VVSTAPPSNLGEGLEIRKHWHTALYHPFLEKDPVFHCWWSLDSLDLRVPASFSLCVCR